MTPRANCGALFTRLYDTYAFANPRAVLYSVGKMLLYSERRTISFFVRRARATQERVTSLQMGAIVTPRSVCCAIDISVLGVYIYVYRIILCVCTFLRARMAPFFGCNVERNNCTVYMWGN